MRPAKKTVMTSPGGVFLLSTSLAPYQNPTDEHGHDGGGNGVDLSCGGGSGGAVRRESGGDEYLGEELYDGKERNSGENDRGKRPGVGYGEQETCKAGGEVLDELTCCE